MKRTIKLDLTKAQARKLFWSSHPEFLHFKTKGKTQNDYPADVRMAWVDFVDYLHKDGIISDRVAADITL